MQGVSRRVAMLFVMIIVYFDRKDTPFQRIAQLFRLFFRLLTEEHRFPDRRAEGQKGPALLLLQWNTRARQFTYISLVAKEMLHKERIFILAARLTRHRVVRTHIKGVAQCVRRDCGHRQCWYKQLYRALAIIVIAEDS